MYITTTTEAALQEALQLTSADFADNVRWNRPPERMSATGSRYACTLRVKSSKEPGHRVHYFMGERTRVSVAACWHVYGTFMDYLWKLSPDAVVRTGRLTMRGPLDNWQDFNIGSPFYPLWYSESCECS